MDERMDNSGLWAFELRLILDYPVSKIVCIAAAIFSHLSL